MGLPPPPPTVLAWVDSDQPEVVKIANSYSRPWGLFLASLLCVVGMSLAVVSKCATVYTFGMGLVELGKNGLFAVATVVIADSSDLAWRMFFIWCARCTTPLWVWSAIWIRLQLSSWGHDVSQNW